MNERQRQEFIDRVFLDACSIEPGEIDAFLDRECEGYPDIRQEVAKLVDADRELGDEDQKLPVPPLRSVFKDIQQAAEEVESQAQTKSQFAECEQCGNRLDLFKNTESAVCSNCGEVTRSMTAIEGSNRELRFDLPKRFEVDRVIGEGSYGLVVKARDSLLERDVAIKIPKGKHVSKKLFVREARIASRLRDKNIVKIHDVNDAEDFAFIVSDFIDGSSLNFWRKQRELSIREVCELCITIARSMENAHQNGVIHRDLKPSNIVMDKAGQPHILDFGLSKSRTTTDGSLVKRGVPIGTPAFMPPEQVEGDADKIDAKSDVYALGIILYQLLTGFLPFSGEEIYESICNDEPTPIQSFGSKFPPALNAIVMKALAKDPEDRYQSAQALADDLIQFIEGRSVQAYPRLDSRVILTSARRWSLVATAFVLAGLLIFAIYLWWGQYRENNPLANVYIETSEPKAELSWTRYSPKTGMLETSESITMRSGSANYVPPGFYKVVARSGNLRAEVFRTVPEKDEGMRSGPGIKLNHYSWEAKSGRFELPSIKLFPFQPKNGTHSYVAGGTLRTGRGPNVSPLFRGRTTEVNSFWISNTEFNIADVKQEFPELKSSTLSFDIAAAFAERKGASIPSVNEYLWIEQTNVEVPLLKSGLMEWTESPLPGVILGGQESSTTVPGNIEKRMVLRSVDFYTKSDLSKLPISHAKWFFPLDSNSLEPNFGFRLVWRN